MPLGCDILPRVVVTITGYKGGTAKTVTAVHVAAYLQGDAPTLLIDADANRSSTTWARAERLPFRVVDERQAPRVSQDFTHVVIDTEARPGRADFKALIRGADLLVIPTPPDALALAALMQTVEALGELGGGARYKVLLTIVPPRPSLDGDEARASLSGAGVALFDAVIPRLAAFGKAALAGVVVSEVRDPRAARGWAAYQAVGKELTHEQI